ncbi:unnamed protein product [Paramecium sonneborni]|uniref:Uncharacterized protein n=1 Tax=Paramecium sonneborni TaxID=65129 RepID=A0A8S1NRP5_9CILI|nr:unnamed protein product [Paramecium sonneborni]
MKIFKSIFKSKKEEIISEVQVEYSTIYDTNSQIVQLEDIKAIIQSEKKRKQLFNRSTTSILEELKVLYTIHMMIIAGQIDDFDQVTQCFQQGKIIFGKIQDQRHIHTYQVNHTVSLQTQQQQKTICYLNSSEYTSQLDDVDTELTKLYYSYLQRAANNSDIYYSSQRMQYPYQDEFNNRRVQYLWLFKLLNLLNFKLAMIPFIQKIIPKQLIITNIVKDIAILIYKDCINEYLFFKKEVEEQIEFYSQFSVKDAISFYELYTQMKFVTEKMKLFHNLRYQFIRHENIRVFNWFVLDKSLEKDIENYIQKAKLINTTQFKNSLQVPSQKAAYEHLSKQLLLPKPQKDIYQKQVLSPENQKKKQPSKQNSQRLYYQY